MLAAEVEMVRGDLGAEVESQRSIAAGHADRAEAQGARIRELEAERDRALTALAQKRTDESDVLLRLGELDQLVTSVAGAIEVEEARVAELERALGTIAIGRDHAAADAPVIGKLPLQSGADAAAQQRIRTLSSELGERDAELLIVHATVATAKKKLGELVELIQRARAGHSGEVAALLERLAADASALAAD
jgi:hypothetical protein